MSDFAQLQSHLAEQDLLSPEISSWSVGEHIHHCCLAAIKILDELKNNEPGLYRPRFSPFRTLVFTTAHIPRGRAKSPSVVIPSAIPLEALTAKIEEAASAMTEMKSLDKSHWMKHPVFGVLSAPLAHRFVEIHNQHHLKIMSDVIKASQDNTT